MESKLEKLMDLLINGIEKGTELASGELPKLMEEILQYEFYSSLTFLSLNLFILIVIPILAFLYHKKHSEDLGDGIMISLIASFILISPLIVVLKNTDNLIKIKVAPKVFVIDYIREKK